MGTPPSTIKGTPPSRARHRQGHATVKGTPPRARHHQGHATKGTPPWARHHQGHATIKGTPPSRARHLQGHAIICLHPGEGSRRRIEVKDRGRGSRRRIRDSRSLGLGCGSSWTTKLPCNSRGLPDGACRRRGAEGAERGGISQAASRAPPYEEDYPAPRRRSAAGAGRKNAHIRSSGPPRTPFSSHVEKELHPTKTGDAGLTASPVMSRGARRVPTSSSPRSGAPARGWPLPGRSAFTQERWAGSRTPAARCRSRCRSIFQDPCGRSRSAPWRSIHLR